MAAKKTRVPSLPAGVQLALAQVQDAEETLSLQKLAFQTEAAIYGPDIQPMRQTLEEIRAEFKRLTVIKAVAENGLIIGSVRAAAEEPGRCWISKLIVHPEWRRRGIAKALLLEVESRFPEARSFELGTGVRSVGNIKLYESLGYREFKRIKPESSPCGPEFVLLAKKA